MAGLRPYGEREVRFLWPRYRLEDLGAMPIRHPALQTIVLRKLDLAESNFNLTSYSDSASLVKVIFRPGNSLGP